MMRDVTCDVRAGPVRFGSGCSPVPLVVPVSQAMLLLRLLDYLQNCQMLS